MSQDEAMRARRPVGLGLQPLFNATSGYAIYVVPAVMVLILQQTLLIGVGMVGGARRERAAKDPAAAGSQGHPALLVAGRSHAALHRERRLLPSSCPATTATTFPGRSGPWPC
jgi:ABC-2 type transport system permease protein